MTRIILDIDNYDDVFVVKELVAMALESFGKVRVVSVIRDGKEEK